MADKTFGFKVSDEDYERAKLLIETSGLSSKEWFQNVLANYEVKALQTNAPEYSRNLTELEKALADEKVKSEQATALLQERHEVALERAIVKAEREYQEKLQAQLDTYNARITELQAENDRIRGTYESRLEELLKNNSNKK